MARVAAAVVALAVLAALPASAAAASATTVQAGSGPFSDDDGSVHEAAFDVLAARGYLAGTECGDGGEDRFSLAPTVLLGCRRSPGSQMSHF